MRIINITFSLLLFVFFSYASAEEKTKKAPSPLKTEISEDSLRVLIPELNWPDSSRVRRSLTLDVALKYPSTRPPVRKIINNSWGVGEKLTFAVNYSFYRAGTATMSVVNKEYVNGGICYNIQTRAESNDFISKFYKVSDTVSSYIDTEGIFSRRFEKKLREGNYKSDHYVDFYQNRKIALNTKKKYSLTEIPLYIQDILSSLYILRTYDLKKGKDESINVYADGKVYPLKVKVYGIENITVPAGKFKCLKVEPLLKSEGIFSQQGQLIVWLTADANKMPVKMESKILIGSIQSMLESYTLAR